jgi:hypothetical protein
MEWHDHFWRSGWEAERQNTLLATMRNKVTTCFEVICLRCFVAKS